MNTLNNRQVLLVKRPHGIPQPEHFEIHTTPIALPSTAPLLIQNKFLSVDPAQRGYVNEENNYVPPVPIGGVMRALAVGEVIHSMAPGIAVGDHLYGWFGWQDYCQADPSMVLRKINPNHGPLTMNLGILGINGLTAYLALHEIGAPEAGQTIVISAGAGALGSIAGQLARKAGCRVVGIVGSEDKRSLCLTRYGYHAAINYKSPESFSSQLQSVCPDGVDIFFDNTGGWILDEALRKMNLHGRVVVCGTVAIPSWQPPPQGPRQEREILSRRLRVQGFVIFDHPQRFNETADCLAAEAARGDLVYDEDIEEGLERAPAALASVYGGKNRGKKIIRLQAA